MKKNILLILLLTFTSSICVAATWQPYKNFNEAIFEGLEGSQRIVLIFPEELHTCGWNNAVNISLSDVGEGAFKTYTSIVLMATAANRQLSVATDGCSGNRAKGISLRLKPQ